MNSRGEMHLFKGEFTDNNTCTPNKKSICGKMLKNDAEKDIFVCKTDDEARMKCAKEGRKVCGPCVSHLYSNFTENSNSIML